MSKRKVDLHWKVNIIGLITETFCNIDRKHIAGVQFAFSHGYDLAFQIFGRIAKRAVELNDKELLECVERLDLLNPKNWSNYDEVMVNISKKKETEKCKKIR